MCCIVEELDLVGEEALWDFPSLSVSQTKIFARHSRPDMQAVIYSMKLSSERNVAMILPLPVAVGSGDDAVVFHDLGNYPDFFSDLENACFCEKVTDPFATLKNELGEGVESEIGADTLKIHDVGDYEASYVPTLNDFGRLDSRFRLPDNVWRQLPIDSDYGFAVFQIRTKLANDGEILLNEVHPMAFEFRTRDTKKLFFPTVHVHDRSYHEQAEFHHSLYCQLNGARAKFKHQRDILGITYNRLASHYEQMRHIYEKYQSIPEIPRPVLDRLGNDVESIEQEMMKYKHPSPAEVMNYHPKHRNEFHGYDWYFTSREEIQRDIDIDRCHGLLEPDRKVEMMVVEGICVNQDVWLGDFIPLVDDTPESESLTDEQIAFIMNIPGKHVQESRYLQLYGFELVDALSLAHGNRLYLVRRVIDFGYSIYDLKNKEGWFDYFLEVDENAQVTSTQLENFKNSTHNGKLTVDQFIDAFLLYPGCAFRPVENQGEMKYEVACRQAYENVNEEYTNFDTDSSQVNLDLARTYINMGDKDGARHILNEILTEGNNVQKATAMKLLDDLK